MSEKLNIIRGCITTKRYVSEEGFGIFILKIEEGCKKKLPPSLSNSSLVTIKGKIPIWAFDIKYEFSGKWESHSKFGTQFAVERYEEIKPENLEDLKIWLSSGLIKNIGTKTADKIIEHFGADSFYIIENEPVRVREVPGVGDKRAEEIAKSLIELKSIREIITFLRKQEIGLATALKIHKKYKNEAIDVIKSNPYKLAEDIDGIGFKISDSIALNMGFKLDSKFRLRALIIYLLKNAENEGHCFLNINQLMDESQKLIGEIPNNYIEVLEELEGNKLFIEELSDVEINIYLLKNYYLEKNIASKLLEIDKTPRDNEWEDCIHEVVEEMKQEDNIELTDEQINVLKTLLKKKVLILTGAAGTGKTQCVKAIIKLLEKIKVSYRLASASGKAANRIEEVTGRSATTIHRLLEFHPQQGFRINRDNQLCSEIIIVDECSMLDVRLLNSLLNAIRNNASLLFIGDYHQIPSISAGNFLYDIIYSKVVTSIELTKIHRQAENSGIIQAAHQILNEIVPDFVPDLEIENFNYSPNMQYYFVKSENNDILNNIIAIIRDITATLALKDPANVIQIITPMNKGEIGTVKINEFLQDYYNHYQNQQLKTRNKVFKLGDKVIQTKNNYDKMIFNGNIGKIVEVNMKDDTMLIKFDLYETPILYQKCDLSEINLAYAISIHKAQGSEYPIVIQIASTSHYIMLQKNLLYTGVTRAKHTSIIIGQKRALFLSVNNNKMILRNTSLWKRLQQGLIEYNSIDDSDDILF